MSRKRGYAEEPVDVGVFVQTLPKVIVPLDQKKAAMDHQSVFYTWPAEDANGVRKGLYGTTAENLKASHVSKRAMSGFRLQGVVLNQNPLQAIVGSSAMCGDVSSCEVGRTRVADYHQQLDKQEQDWAGYVICFQNGLAFKYSILYREDEFLSMHGLTPSDPELYVLWVWRTLTHLGRLHAHLYPNGLPVSDRTKFDMTKPFLMHVATTGRFIDDLRYKSTGKFIQPMPNADNFVNDTPRNLHFVQMDIKQCMAKIQIEGDRFKGQLNVGGQTVGFLFDAVEASPLAPNSAHFIGNHKFEWKSMTLNCGLMPTVRLRQVLNLSEDIALGPIADHAPTPVASSVSSGSTKTAATTASLHSARSSNGLQAQVDALRDEKDRLQAEVDALRAAAGLSRNAHDAQIAALQAQITTLSNSAAATGPNRDAEIADLRKQVADLLATGVKLPEQMLDQLRKLEAGQEHTIYPDAADLFATDMTVVDAAKKITEEHGDPTFTTERVTKKSRKA